MTNLDKLKDLLAELFMLDQADLDFGIYRVMNAKRAEVTRFLDHDLLPQVRAELEKIQTGDRAGLETELAKAIQNALALGLTAAEAERVEKVKNLRAQLAATVDVSALENEVLSDLANFFRRYYSGGDFLALRRYKAGVYAIPYEGEEVKLHWANADQYYIKTSEFLRDYTFKLADGKRIHFKLVEADTEADNKKAAAGQERRFILCAADPLLESDGELVIRFEYRPDADKRKQTELNTLATEAILNVPGFAAWKAALARLAPTEKNPDRKVLEKHLGDYTARNSFDYFIHKDIGGFLRRELDFYIKNEIMHLDDIEREGAPRVEQYLAKILAIRKISGKIIDFLEQLENFQKKLWLKKKFVVETNYCVTLDRVAETLYPEIAANDAQWQEWEKLFAISEIAPDLFNQKKKSRDAKFLKANLFLVLDTKLFPSEFKEKLLASDEVLNGAATLDEATNGLLVHSENFQVANLMLNFLQDRLAMVYLDPPYNTSEFSFVYKNNYKDSSWMSMIQDRVALSLAALKDSGIIGVAIDDAEHHNLRHIMDRVCGAQNWLATISAEINPAGQNIRPNVPARSHDYCLFYASNIDNVEMLIRELTEEEKAQYTEKDKKGQFLWDNLRRRGGNSRPSDRPRQYYPLFCTATSVRVPKMNWDEQSLKWVLKEEPMPEEIISWPVDPKGEDRIWRTSPEAASREIASGDISITTKAGRLEVIKKSRMPEGKKPKTQWSDSRYSATSYGSKLLGNILGRANFSYPKSLHLVEDCLRYWLPDDGIVMDLFGGSGTTAHAAISLNREDDGNRKYVLAEMGDYFDTVLKPRIQKVIYSKDWKDGKDLEIFGAQIDSDLNIYDEIIPFRVAAVGCKFTGGINFSGCHFRGLALAYSHFAGLTAHGLNIDDDLDLSFSETTDPIQLESSHIGRNLNCGVAKFLIEDHAAVAICLNKIQIGGSILLNNN
jgi:adenine-specific DNA-methyltransferase